MVTGSCGPGSSWALVGSVCVLSADAQAHRGEAFVCSWALWPSF